MLSIENLEKELKQEKLNSLYLLYGEEVFLLENSVKKIKKLFGEIVKGINYILIDDTNVKELISDIETPAFGYEKKLIVARNTGLFKADGKRKNKEVSDFKEKLNDFLNENIDIINESVILVFVEEEADSRLKLFKTLEKQGVVCKFDFLKPIQVEKRIKAVCDAYNVKIDSSTIKYFIEICGTNMQDVINEIRKLIEYAGNGGSIKKEDIDSLTIKKLEAVIFDLTDNLGQKQTKKALEVLKNLIYNKEPIQRILVMLYNHFKKLYFLKIATKYNKDIVTALNLKPNQVFLVNKYKKQASYFSEKELKEVLQAIRDLDINYKNGLIDLEVGLEAILCNYCS